MSDVRVRFLGTGSPFASGGRLQSCILLDGPAGRVLLDCGATALWAMERFAVDPSSIDAVVITHFHGDHVGGLPFLLLESEFGPEQGSGRPLRQRPLVIAGPAGIEERVRQLCSQFEYGAGFSGLQHRGVLQFVSLEPQREMPVGACSVTAFPVRHTPEALALRVGYGGRTIAYSGDTGWTDALPRVADGADLLICQVYTFTAPMQTMLSYRELEAHHRELTCKRLILTHVGAEMQQHLGDVDETVAEDGLEIVL
jgi:ribonuclease BN (tRNA processing enzyme)